MFHKKLVFILFLIFNSLNIFSQTEQSLVKWVDFETAQKNDSIVDKPFLIDVYTDWCGWCKQMLKTTYSNQSIASYINTNFYPVAFNAEKVDTITFKGKKYYPKGKNNELAIELLSGRMSYPTTVFIARNGQSYAVPGYLKPHEIEPFLVYFAEDLITTVNINDFHSDFIFTYPKNFSDVISKIPDSLKPDTTGIAKWYKLNEALELSKKTKKKFILFTSVSWFNSCRVMRKITFSNSTLTKLLNENYYLVDFDAATEDTIVLNNKKYVSLGKGQPHQLAMELFQGKFTFPAIFIFDENFNYITSIYGYQRADFLTIVFEYFKADSIWKNQSFETFAKTYKPKN